jgi:alpha-glucosidase
MMRIRRSFGLLVLAAALAAAGLSACTKPAAKTAAPTTPAVAHSEAGKIQRIKYQGAGRYLTVEVLADDLLHFELAAGTSPIADTAIPTTPMVARTDYPGPSSFTQKENTFETADLKVTIDPEKLCVTTFDKHKNATLTTTCPTAVTGTWKGLTLTPEKMQNVYGLGEQFSAPNMPDGDWVGRQRTSGIYGNVMAGFNGGSAENAQFPIMYAVGPESTNYALFLDDIYGQKWDFRSSPWKAESSGDAIRWFLMSGPTLADLRQGYMALTGRPPVPPKQMFGLWISEYGYQDWAELDGKLKTLRSAGFPLDGAVLDLQWFGGINSSSDETNMGRLIWDTNKFPNPAAKIAAYRRNDGIGIMTIEESYIGRALPEWNDLAQRGYLIKQANGDPA